MIQRLEYKLLLLLSTVFFCFILSIACEFGREAKHQVDHTSHQISKKKPIDSISHSDPYISKKSDSHKLSRSGTHHESENTSAHSQSKVLPSATEKNIESQKGIDPPLWVSLPIEDQTGDSLSTFYRALHRVQAQNGQARITFYGASHVASDLFTGLIRQRLQHRFGNAGPGFVLPAKPWRWHRHSGIKYLKTSGWNTLRVIARDPEEGIYGYAGVALESQPKKFARGLVETRDNGELVGNVSQFELFYMKQPHGGKMWVLIDGKRVRKISTNSTGIELAYDLFRVEDEHHSFEIRTMGDGAVRIFGVSLERDQPGIILDTVGIPGSRARYHLLWNDSVYREHLKRRSPDLIVLAYGTNESMDDDIPIELYESRLREVLKRIQGIGLEASCLLVGPSDYPEQIDDSSYQPRQRTAQIIEVQRRVSAEFSCGFFDLVGFMGGPMSMIRWVSADPPYGAPDHIHYTLRGYHQLGEVLVESLLAGYMDGSTL